MTEKKQTLLNKLLSGDAKESSKRALAMYVVLVLGTIITGVSLWNGVDYIILLGTWLGFAAALLGLSEYTKNRAKKHEAAVEVEKVKASNGANEEEPAPPPDDEVD